MMQQTASAAYLKQGRVVTKFITRTFSALACAALLAGSATILSASFSGEVVAKAPLNSGKADRLDIRPVGATCSQQAWPYYEAKCLRDNRTSLSNAKPARVVTADRN